MRKQARTRRFAARVSAIGAALALGVAGAIVIAQPAAADPITRYVDVAGSDAGNDCAVTACLTIAHAVSQSVAGDTISVGAGTFAGDVDVAIDLTIVGTESAGTLQTLIRVDLGRTVTVSGAADVTLQSLDIAGDGLSDFGSWEDPVRNFGTGTLSIIGSSIRDVDTVVVSNLSSGHVVISDSSIGGSGGNSGVSNESTGTVLISDSVISDNNGHGVSTNGTGQVTIESTLITNNSMHGVSNWAAADIVIRDSAITANGYINSSDYVGVHNGNAGTITIEGSTISGNESGGVINGYSDGSTTGHVTVITSTIDGGDEPAIYTYGPATTALIGSTVYSQGGTVGSWMAGGQHATVTLAGTLLINDATNPSACFGNSNFVDLGYNVGYTDPAWGELYCDFTTVTSIESASALGYGPLADNGGDHETRLPATAAPTFNFIPPGTTVALPGDTYELCAGTDQRGVPRPQGTNCEPGAVELASTTLALSSTPNPSEVGDAFTLVAAPISGVVGPTLPDPTGTVSFFESGGVTPVVGCGDVAVDPVTVTASCSVTAAATGTFSYFAVYTPTNGYVPSMSAQHDHDVSLAIVTITASNETMTYGGAEPTPTPSYSGFDPGDDETSLTTAPTCTVDTVAKTTQCSGAVHPSYDFAYIAGTLTVDPVTLTVTASNETMEYGGTVPTPSPEYAGFVGGDDENDLVAEPVCSADTVSKLTSCSGGDPGDNYVFSFATGTLTVTPVVLTVTASNESLTYGDPLPTPTPGYSGFVGGDTDAVVTIAPSCVSDLSALSTSCTGGDAGLNYLIVHQAGTLALTKASLTVTASSETMTFGDPVPAVTPQYSGFVLGDDAGDLDAEPTCTADEVGLATSCSGGTSALYAFAYLDGVLTVTPAPFTILTVSLPDAAQGQAYFATLAGTGGLGGPYTWALQPGSTLPPNLSLLSDGTITGTPTVSGSFSFTVLLNGQTAGTVTLAIAGLGLAGTGFDATPVFALGALGLLAGLATVLFMLRMRRVQ